MEMQAMAVIELTLIDQMTLLEISATAVIEKSYTK